MTKYSFDQLDQWSDKQIMKVGLICRTAGQAVLRKAQTPKAKGGNMPVDRGQLRNSLASGLNGAVNLTGATSYVAVLAGFTAHDALALAAAIETSLGQVATAFFAKWLPC